MTGWEATRRVTLDPPWADFWLDLWEDPPMGDWIRVQSAAQEALSSPSEATIRAAIASFGLLVADHNLRDRYGEPLTELTLETLSSSLFRAILDAIRREMATVDGGADDPLPESRVPSPGT